MGGGVGGLVDVRLRMLEVSRVQERKDGDERRRSGGGRRGGHTHTHTHTHTELHRHNPGKAGRDGEWLTEGRSNWREG